MTFTFNPKGQGALEYLLLIGGAVLIAAIVLAVVVSIAGQGQTAAGGNVTQAQCAPYNQERCTLAAITDFDGDGTADCQWDATAGCIPA